MSFGKLDQENLLAVIAHDDSPGGCITAAAMLPASAWDRHYRRIFDKLRSFIERFQTSPREHFLDIVSDLCEAEPDSKEIYQQIHNSAVVTWQNGVNREFVYQRARLFGRAARLRQGIGEALTHLEKELSETTVANAEIALEGVKKSNIEVVDTGISSRDTDAMMQAVLDPDPPAFTLGIDELDEVGAGPAVGELWLLAGKYGSGKSWGLLNAGLTACLVDEAKVLYCPLEMRAKQAIRRIMQMAFGFGTRAQTVDVTRLVKDSAGRVVDFDPDSLEVPSLYDENNHGALRQKVEGFRSRAEFRVKAWPSGTLNIRQLEAYLDAAHGEDGFVPDLVLLDYFQICEITSPANKRVELGQICIDFRGLADTRGFAAGSALQINREGSGSNRATGQHLSEDFTAAATADKLLIYNQSEMEAALGMARLSVDKLRTDGGVQEVLITQSYAAGQYAMESARVTQSYESALEKIEARSDDDD